eukprot:TRINITY_DN5094_c0_g1_i2.p2 TRINITY_DN5094_c0_g1~~TRINITY_DN5094_c0_g1_i2.p2  ORF type:complete len:141 (+),score=3.04 TRINITY_DN5094_c0_g1_i2:524-946(+)
MSQWPKTLFENQTGQPIVIAFVVCKGFEYTQGAIEPGQTEQFSTMPYMYDIIVSQAGHDDDAAAQTVRSIYCFDDGKKWIVECKPNGRFCLRKPDAETGPNWFTRAATCVAQIFQPAAQHDPAEAQPLMHPSTNANVGYG